MPLHLRIVTPIVVELFTDDMVRRLERPGLRLSNTHLRVGPASVESAFDEALALPDTLRCIVEAQRDGCDGVVINCFGDPGLQAGREVVDIPVVGPCQAAMHLATILGHRFGVLSVLENVRLLLNHLAETYGLAARYGSFRSVDIPVLELESDPERLAQALSEQALRAVRDDGVDVVILGCTGMFGCAAAIRANLLKEGIGVPVIDPLEAAVSLAITLAGTGLSQSRRAYHRPPAKEVRGYDLPS